MESANMLFTIRPLQWEPDPVLGGETAKAPSGTLSLIPLNMARTSWRWRYMSRGIFHESDTFKTRDEAAASADKYYGGVLLMPYLDIALMTSDAEAVKSQAVRIRDLVSEVVQLQRQLDEGKRWGILYSMDGAIYKQCDAATEEEAITSAKKANKKGEFNIYDNYVYLLSPTGTITDLTASDLGV